MFPSIKASSRTDLDKNKLWNIARKTSIKKQMNCNKSINDQKILPSSIVKYSNCKGTKSLEGHTFVISLKDCLDPIENNCNRIKNINTQKHSNKNKYKSCQRSLLSISRFGPVNSDETTEVTSKIPRGLEMNRDRSSRMVTRSSISGVSATGNSDIWSISRRTTISGDGSASTLLSVKNKHLKRHQPPRGEFTHYPHLFVELPHQIWRGIHHCCCHRQDNHLQSNWNCHSAYKNSVYIGSSFIHPHTRNLAITRQLKMQNKPELAHSVYSGACNDNQEEKSTKEENTKMLSKTNQKACMYLKKDSSETTTDCGVDYHEQLTTFDDVPCLKSKDKMESISERLDVNSMLDNGKKINHFASLSEDFEPDDETNHGKMRSKSRKKSLLVHQISIMLDAADSDAEQEDTPQKSLKTDELDTVIKDASVLTLMKHADQRRIELQKLLEEHAAICYKILQAEAKS